MTINILALDIGGAFIKITFLKSAGKPQRQTKQKPKKQVVPFELWKHPQKLAAVLRRLAPQTKRSAVAITMTGELCDCFADRRRGVKHIVDSTVKVFGKSVKIFGRKGALLSPSNAIANYTKAASANWAAAPLYLSGRANDFLFIDIGSTTTDLTPVRKGKLACKGWDDFGRLSNGELLYTGYLRTPVPSVVSSLTARGKQVPVSSETFAIMGDAHLTLGAISPSKYLCPTPDGGAKTKHAAMKRLARTVLADARDLNRADIMSMAKQAARAQRHQIIKAAKRFRLRIIATGAGAFILNKALRSGELKSHPLSKDPYLKNLDPSLALALMLNEGRL